MNTFNPIITQDSRYVAVCKDGYIFVADAEVYDYDHNERATIVYMESISAFSSFGEMITIFDSIFYADSWNEFDGNCWENSASKIELILLYKKYIGELSSIG